MKTNDRLRSGDWVEVRPPQEIAATLDNNGTLDGLPFMPEMANLCGQRFRVQRRAEKSCVECADSVYRLREFIRDDVVLLEGFRCSGANHDGCQRECLVFWRTAWLRKVADGVVSQKGPPPGLEQLQAQLKTKSGPNRYFCQSTEMEKITRPQTRSGILLKCFSEIGSGSRRIPEMARLVFVPLWRKLTARWVDRSLVGTLTKTPVAKLDLQLGEWVELKSAEEVAQTLDKKGRNRGLLVDAYAHNKYRDGRYQVRTRVARMIKESSGEMCTLDNTVILDNVICPCFAVLGGCPRQEPVFWREIWLKRCKADAAVGQVKSSGDTIGEPKSSNVNPPAPARPAV